MTGRATAQRKEAEITALPCACANLRRAARAVTQLYSQEIRRSGVDATQFSLLMALGHAGETTQGRLGERLVIDSTTLTRTLAPLRARGWIASKPGADRRQRLWRLTPAGRRQLQRARPHWERAQKRLRKALGEAEWNSLQTSVARTAQAAQHA